jgi:sulfonate transport system substrate-binding protein
MSKPFPPRAQTAWTRRRFLYTVGAAGLAIPLAAACGGGDDSASSATTSATAAQAGASSTTAPAKRKKVRLTYSATTIAFARAEVFNKGLADKGIDVEWVGPFPNHAPTIQAVLGDTADFSFGGSTTPANQAIVSAKGALVYAAFSKADPAANWIFTLPGSGINSVAGLMGKKVALNKAGVSEYVAYAALEKNQVPRDDVEFVYLNPPEAGPAFAAGQVDAWSIWGGPGDKIKYETNANTIFDEGKDLDFRVDFGSYVVRRDYAEKEPDTIRTVIAAYQEQQEWQNANFAASYEIINKVAQYPQPVVDAIVARGSKTKLSLIDDQWVQTVQTAADWLVERNIISDKIDIAKNSVNL